MIIIAYVPVIHAGYIKFFQRHCSATKLYVLGQELIDQFLQGHPEIRAVDPLYMVKLLRQTHLFPAVEMLTPQLAAKLVNEPSDKVLPDDTISRRFAEKYLPDRAQFETVFLRWDESNVLSNHDVDCDRISTDTFDQELMRMAAGEAHYTTDWWRQVGGILVRNGQVIWRGHNRHVPSEEAPYAQGDPRDFIKAGQFSNISTALHLEQGAITWAAREGLSLRGSHLYVTTFPCPMCAKQVAFSGVSKLFFCGGHASLDGQAVLKSQGVELIQVPLVL